MHDKPNLLARFLLPALFLLAGRAGATIPDLVGMGPDNIGMAGAVTALAADPYAAYYNPAGIAQTRHVVLEMGYILGQANLQGFTDIVYDTDGDGLVQDMDGYPDYGDVGADYRVGDSGTAALFYGAGLQLGAIFPIWRHVSLGLAAHLPSASLMRMELENPYIPYYVMFRNRNNRFSASPALAIQPVRGVYLGIGAQLRTRMVTRLRISSYTDIETFSSTTGEGEPEVVGTIQANVDEMVMSLEPDLAPNFGFLLDLGALFEPDDPLHDAFGHVALGVAWRGPWLVSTNVDATILANGHVTFDDQDLLLSSLLEEPMEVELRDMTSFYDPPQLALGIKLGYSGLVLAGDLTWVRWSSFTETVAPYSETTIESLAGTSVTIQSGYEYPDPDFRDTWTLRVGGVFSYKPWPAARHLGNTELFLRAGYAFVPSPVPDQTGLTNYMDSDRTVLAGGLGIQAGRIKGFSRGPVRLDIGGQYHVLETRTVQKDPGLVADQDGDGILDYPQGYPLSGEITSAGELWAVSVGIQMSFDDPKPWPRSMRRFFQGRTHRNVPSDGAGRQPTPPPATENEK